MAMTLRFPGGVGRRKLQDALRQSEIALALGTAICRARSVPSGELYGTVLGFLSLEDYERAIDALVAIGSVKRQGDILVWVETETA
jgi:hypothetical protein